MESKNIEKRREGEKRKREEEEEEERKKDQKEKRYGISMVLGMETKIFVWFVWIVMGCYEFVDFYMKFLLELGFEELKSVITC